MATEIDQLRELVTRRIDELRAAERQLEAALEHLDGATATGKVRGTTNRRKPAKRKRSRRKAKRAPRGQRREQMLAALKSKPGSSPRELAEAVGVNPNQIYALLRVARAEKLVVKKGSGYALK
jgi:hypothetical protein